MPKSSHENCQNLFHHVSFVPDVNKNVKFITKKTIYTQPHAQSMSSNAVLISVFLNWLFVMAHKIVRKAMTRKTAIVLAMK